MLLFTQAGRVDTFIISVPDASWGVYKNSGEWPKWQNRKTLGSPPPTGTQKLQLFAGQLCRQSTHRRMNTTAEVPPKESGVLVLHCAPQPGGPALGRWAPKSVLGGACARESQKATGNRDPLLKGACKIAHALRPSEAAVIWKKP